MIYNVQKQDSVIFWPTCSKMFEFGLQASLFIYNLNNVIFCHVCKPF